MIALPTAMMDFSVFSEQKSPQNAEFCGCTRHHTGFGPTVLQSVVVLSSLRSGSTRRKQTARLRHGKTRVDIYRLKEGFKFFVVDTRVYLKENRCC